MAIIAPPLVCVYGQAATGKTSDKIWAAPNGLFFAGPGALIPSVSTVGYSLPAEQVIEVDPTTGDLSWLRGAAEQAVRRGKKKYNQIIIDDFSMVMHRTARREKAKYKDGRMLYGALRHIVGEALDEWRSWGCSVLVDCHAMDPLWITEKEDSSKRIRLDELGTPDLPGRKAAPDLVKAFDMCLRVVPDRWRKPWPYVYHAGPHGSEAELWRTKDRWSIIPPIGSPMNLGELLRAIPEYKTAGILFPRAPGMEWAEEMIQWGFGVINSGQPVQAVSQQIATRLNGRSIPIWQIRWVLRDLQARVEIAQRPSVLEGFGVAL